MENLSVHSDRKGRLVFFRQYFVLNSHLQSLSSLAAGDFGVGHTMKIIIPGIFIFAVLAMRITKYFDLPKWQTSIGLIVFAGLLYFINIFLIRYYIRKRTPEFANDDMWEMTAGLGIVPKWVSMLGLLSLSALITAVVPWIIELIKHIL